MLRLTPHGVIADIPLPLENRRSAPNVKVLLSAKRDSPQLGGTPVTDDPG
jgi:hypothetical protein